MEEIKRTESVNLYHNILDRELWGNPFYWCFSFSHLIFENYGIWLSFTGYVPNSNEDDSLQRSPLKETLKEIEFPSHKVRGKKIRRRCRKRGYFYSKIVKGGRDKLCCYNTAIWCSETGAAKSYLNNLPDTNTSWKLTFGVFMIPKTVNMSSHIFKHPHCLTMIWGEHHHSVVRQAQLVQSSEQPSNLSVHVRHCSKVVLTETQLEDDGNKRHYSYFCFMKRCCLK